MPRQAGANSGAAVNCLVVEQAFRAGMAPETSLDVPGEVLEVAVEIASGSDVVGIERWRLEWLLRAALYVDRRKSASHSLNQVSALWTPPN